jgi:FKBP-type peptidyl-prolyl cis-trans isomerase FkpA
MKKQPGYFLVLLTVVALSFASCKNNADYKKTKSGIMYKIFSDGKDSVAKTGNTVKMDLIIKIGSTDSVLQTTVGKTPAYIPMQGEVPANAYSQLEVFPLLRKGDSVVIVQLTDTLFKKNPQMPPFIKKGDRLITIIKVLDIFRTQEAEAKDKETVMAKEKIRQEQEMETDLVKGTADMSAWLAENKIAAVKAGKGTFVVIKDPGTGRQADSGKYASVRYNGKDLSGKTFETNMDPKAPPFTFQVATESSSMRAIRGWDEGLPLFKKGGKGTLYVPGALAYGRYPPQNSPFKPNQALVFDIEVVEVSDTPPPPQQQQQLPPEIRAQIEKQQQMQKQQLQKKPAH